VKIFRISSKKFTYFGQCDRVRRCCGNEEKWQEMIKNHTKIDIETFKALCNYEILLEDDETLEEYIADDQGAYFAISNWGDLECCYLMRVGFEFIFVEDGK
jgi:hypothetical protein